MYLVWPYKSHFIQAPRDQIFELKQTGYPDTGSRSGLKETIQPEHWAGCLNVICIYEQDLTINIPFVYCIGLMVKQAFIDSSGHKLVDISKLYCFPVIIIHSWFSLGLKPQMSWSSSRSRYSLVFVVSWYRLVWFWLQHYPLGKSGSVLRLMFFDLDLYLISLAIT